MDRIYDTKYILDNHPELKRMIGGNVPLGTAYEKTEKNMQLRYPHVIKDKEMVQDSDVAHQAAYDAFITGAVFAKFSHFIGLRRDKLYKRTMASFDHLIGDFENRLFLMKLETPLCVLEEEPPLDRSNIFVLTELKPEVTNDDVYAVFNPFGPIRVVWVNGQLAYVLLQDRNKVGECANKVIDNSTFPFNVSLLDNQGL